MLNDKFPCTLIPIENVSMPGITFGELSEALAATPAFSKMREAYVPTSESRREPLHRLCRRSRR